MGKAIAIGVLVGWSYVAGAVYGIGLDKPGQPAAMPLLVFAWPVALVAVWLEDTP
jgi:hypothetical protein